MVSMPRVAAVLNWRNEKNKSGCYPVHIRIKMGNTSRYYNVPIPQKIKPEQWAGKDNNWVKPSQPFAFEINSRIIELKASISEYIKRTFGLNKPVTVPGIIGHLTNKGDNKSFVYCLTNCSINSNCASRLK
jgi:hypothetical protein